MFVNRECVFWALDFNKYVSHLFASLIVSNISNFLNNELAFFFICCVNFSRLNPEDEHEVSQYLRNLYIPRRAMNTKEFPIKNNNGNDDDDEDDESKQKKICSEMKCN